MKLLTLSFIALAACALAPLPQSKLVSAGSGGKLVYTPDKSGNTIPDFSTCGYMGGGVKLPDVPVVATLQPQPSGTDDTPRIQAAIDELSKKPADSRGLRGALLLKRGTYRLGTSIRIRASGVVLRGEGDGEDGTILLGTGTKQRALIQVGGEGKPQEVAGSSRKITDNVVPVGAKEITLENTRGLQVGQRIIARRSGNASWIHTLKMDQIPVKRGAGTKQWQPFDIDYQRVITKIDGSRITIDAPVCCPIQQEYGGGSVLRYEFPGRIEQVGVESLRGVSEYDQSKKDKEGKRFVDEAHAWSLVEVNNTENGWVRQVSARYFGYSCVSLQGQASHCTVQDCTCLEMVAIVTGGRMYCFNLTGQQNLFLRCKALDARHAFVLGARTPGPNVYLDCTSVSDQETGPHHRWSTGTLFDNVTVEQGGLRVYDRGNMGTGHGWSGAYQVFWNCTAGDIRNNNPPTAINWAIGCTVKKHEGDGWWESADAPVDPKSLYLKQLEDRLGRQAVANLAPSAR